MGDDFHFGERARRPARLGKAPGPRTGGSIDGRILWIAGGLVVAGLLAFVFLRGADEAGRRIGDANGQAVDQIDQAHDAAAKASIGRAVVVAQTLHAEHGSFTTDLATLSAYDSSIRFTSGRSTGPTSIAYVATETAFAAAVRSESGTCWWVRTDVNGTTTYGRGTPCTGNAAMAAADPSL